MTTFTSFDQYQDLRSRPFQNEAADCAAARRQAYFLIVDSDPGPLLSYLRNTFPDDGYRTEVIRTGAAAIERIAVSTPDVVLLDQWLPDQGGLEVLEQMRLINPSVPVIFLSANRGADTVIQAMKRGAYDFVFTPLDGQHLRQVLSAAIEVAPSARITALAAPANSPTNGDGLLCGASPKMREVLKSIGLVASQNVNVLITGESGTGKELVARAIYEHSARSDAHFLALNCAAIPENLLESELFGHEKGAFSGADRRRVGKFEQCNSGTILLDEIGDMPLSLQAKILRLLQEQTFERIGGNETIRTNVRIIASTHRDLKSWSAMEKFRADLYYRLSVFTIRLPPLRERLEDLPTLVHHFVGQYSDEMGRKVRQIAPETMEKLKRYHWPGNIRELQSVLRQALLHASGEVLLPGFLPSLSDGPAETPPARSRPTKDFDIDEFLRQRLGPDTCNLYEDMHRELDRHSLARVMNFTRGNRHMASRVLGIARQTLRLKLRESGVQITQSFDARDEEPISVA